MLILLYTILIVYTIWAIMGIICRIKQIVQKRQKGNGEKS